MTHERFYDAVNGRPANLNGVQRAEFANRYNAKPGIPVRVAGRRNPVFSVRYLDE